MGIFSFLKAKKTINRGYLSSYDQQVVRQKWLEIESLLTAGNPAAKKQAVLAADKVLDYALDRLYPNLETTGERLKAAREIFQNNKSDYDQLWFAHKVRNEMVHNLNFELPAVEAKNTTEKIRTGLRRMGASL